jgi:hypothetical protein
MPEESRDSTGPAPGLVPQPESEAAPTGAAAGVNPGTRPPSENVPQPRLEGAVPKWGNMRRRKKEG